ncbi:DUF1822 family protein [Leptothermofonsia sp. ETS-13]|uniref:DUF1822 family protein n=1 Tax=Leptothermofonsia sp. ETS-13 TaxID=3035696 RepID=UPI003BA3D94B
MRDLAVGVTDFRLLHPEVIALEPEDFDQAATVSDRVLHEPSQWQTYLNGLGAFGFARWLQERLPNLVLNLEESTLWQPQYARVLDGVCNARLGEFKLCLIATEHLLAEAIALPRAALDLPELAAHFYMLLEVQEELDQVAIQGILRYDQLVDYRQSVHLPMEPDWNYLIPLSLFDGEVNHLLSYVRHLQPDAIALPVAPSLAPVQPLPATELNAFVSRLHTPDQPLWQILTWEQGARILQNPEFLALLDQWPRSPEPLPPVRFTELFMLLAQPTINVAQWLRGEIDTIAQSLGLFLPEELATASPMLSVDRFERAIAELRSQGMEIPPQPNSLYQDIDLAEIALRLCAVTWAADTHPLEWSLLLIVGMRSGGALPDGLKLRVSNARGVLHEPTAEFDDPFLFARVQGITGEQFVVTLLLPNHSGLTLPAFRFGEG